MEIGVAGLDPSRIWFHLFIYLFIYSLHFNYFFRNRILIICPAALAAYYTHPNLAVCFSGLKFGLCWATSELITSGLAHSLIIFPLFNIRCPLNS
jgi:hypothetical protein